MKVLCKEEYWHTQKRVNRSKPVRFVTAGLWYELLNEHICLGDTYYEIISDINTKVLIRSFRFYTKQELRRIKLKKLKDESFMYQ